MIHDTALKEKANELSKEIIGAAIEVHRYLGPGLLKSAYEACLSHELDIRGLRSRAPLTYRIGIVGQGRFGG